MIMEVYLPEEIVKAIDLLEGVQDMLDVEDIDVLWDMIEEAVAILKQEVDEE
jgi:hypothetical protein